MNQDDLMFMGSSYNQSLWQMVASWGIIISRVHNVKTIGNSCLQTFMGDNSGWCYTGS
jgi:hypothetical protein